jgi:hypothetical protein
MNATGGGSRSVSRQDQKVLFADYFMANHLTVSDKRGPPTASVDCPAIRLRF